jgi:hypothetical protein
MTGNDPESGNALADETVSDDTADTADQTTEQAPPENEARAKRMGWIPKEQYRGDPSRWVDADAFVRRSEEELPIMRERMRTLDQKLEKTDTELRRMVRESRTLSQVAYDRAVADIKASQLQAVEAGDTEAFKRTEQQLDALAKKAEPEKVADAPPPDPAFSSWQDKNKWYWTDPELKQVGIAAFARISQAWGRDPNTMDAERLEAVSQEVQKRYPERFPNAGASNGNGQQTQQRRSASVEGGGEARGGKRGKSYADLPADAKAAADRFVKQGIYKTKDEYAADYFSENGDSR